MEIATGSHLSPVLVAGAVAVLGTAGSWAKNIWGALAFSNFYLFLRCGGPFGYHKHGASGHVPMDPHENHHWAGALYSSNIPINNNTPKKFHINAIIHIKVTKTYKLNQKYSVQN